MGLVHPWVGLDWVESEIFMFIVGGWVGSEKKSWCKKL